MQRTSCLNRWSLSCVALVVMTAGGCGGSEHAAPKTPSSEARSHTTLRVSRMTAHEQDIDDAPPPPVPETTPFDAPYQYDFANVRRIRSIPIAHVERWPIDAWTERYPEAKRELQAWVREFPEAADRLFAWDATHTDQVEVLVQWAITHPYENLNAFLLTRHAWSDLHEMLEARYRGALDAFLNWARRAPDAADELVTHPRGLAWAGEHLLQRDTQTARH